MPDKHKHTNTHTILCQITLPRSRGEADVQNALDAFDIKAKVEPFGDGKLPNPNTRRGRRALQEEEDAMSRPSTTCHACDTECPGHEFWQYCRPDDESQTINLCDDCHDDAADALPQIDLDADILNAEDFAALKKWIADENPEL